MDQEGSKEDSARCLSRIRQVRCLPWGWTRHSHCGTCAVTNIHPARYRRHSSRCSSHDWGLCSVLPCFGQPGQPLLLPLSWPPHLALCSSQEQEWVGAGRESAARCFTSGVSCCTCTPGENSKAPGEGQDKILLKQIPWGRQRRRSLYPCLVVSTGGWCLPVHSEVRSSGKHWVRKRREKAGELYSSPPIQQPMTNPHSKSSIVSAQAIISGTFGWG